MSGRGFGAAAGGSARDHGATIVVAALSAMFAATLIQTVGILTAAIDPQLVEESGTMRMMLFIVATVFILIALYVGSIVTANTFSTIIAGRARTIALLRLVGASSRRVRSRVAFEGLMVGLIGAAIGFAASWLLCTVFVSVAPGQGWLPAGHDYPLFDPLALVGVAVVALTTWVSAWVGSRRVGAVSPIAATGASVELDPESAQHRTGRTVFSVILLVLGAGVLALGVLVGLVSPLGLLVAFFGGLASFTGIAIGAHWIMPPLLRLSGRLLGRGVTGRLAAANAVRFPERSARATIGLVIGVTLVTMFAVALQTYQQMTMQVFDGNPAMKEALESTFAVTMAILTGLVGFSAVIAAVGMVNTLSLSVLQRTRELGLLRALGFTGRQVRGTITAESAQMTFAALVFGLLLGTFYGWVAAQSMLGQQAGLMPPSIPWGMIAGVAVFGAVLAMIASAAPARRAIRVSPVAALAVD